jgi:hypothetical protein
MTEIEKLAGKVINNKQTSMSISRLPKQTREKFVKLAEEEFCNDYGMTLKFLFDNYQRSSSFEYLLEEIDTLKNTILFKGEDSEESKPKETEQKKMVDGTTISGGKEE